MDVERRHWRTPDANMERGNRSYENMKMRLEMGEPINLNDQLNAISMGLLPTPRNNTGPSTDKKHLSLDGVVKLFPTPGAGNPGSRPNGKGGKVLAEEVKKRLWSTPAAADAVGSHGGGQGRSLRTDIYNWKHGLCPTPQSRDFRSGQAERVGRKGKQNNLNDFVRLFPTPLASDADKYNLNRDKHLPGAVRKYPAPTVQDYKHRGPGGGAQGQLSADWVEALMGYPQGWTNIDKEAGYENDYPEKWIDDTWEDSIPRLAVKQPHRVSRLKCLGNAVVPQIPMMIWLMIKDFL
ncbi:MAG: hypothetical protein LBT33_07830 [Spirochaetia bacterium]|jgi:hypothetical protein|nr:hypothetical protein [Spirochaetia bacterium]